MNPERHIPSTHRGPGLVDLQVNGYAGFDFNGPPEAWTAEALGRVREAMARRGVTAALPTLITDDPDRMAARAGRYGALTAAHPELARAFPRLHVEGPFLSPEDGPRGAHPRRYCTTPRARPGLMDRLRAASGDRIGLVTLAPELEGALDLVADLAAAGACVALGHTAASVETIREAVAAGARLSTHLGNGCHLLLPRTDNYVQAQLAEDGLCASFVADGHHLPFYTLKNFLRAKTPARSVLVTDAIAAADAGPGRYTLAGAEVVVTPELRAYRPDQPGFLAGSALTLDRAVLGACRHAGVSFEEAWAMASTQPAALAGLESPPEVEVEITAEGFRRVEGAVGTG